MADSVNIKTKNVVQMQDEDFESSQDSTPKVLRSDLATRLANKWKRDDSVNQGVKKLS